MNAAGPSQNTGGPTSLDDVLQQLTTSTNINSLHHYLKSFAPKESRDIILASTLSSGQDPLSVLDPQRNTLGFLYILYVHRSRSSAICLNHAAVQPDCTRQPRQHLTLLSSRPSVISLTLRKRVWHQNAVRSSLYPCGSVALTSSSNTLGERDRACVRKLKQREWVQTLPFQCT